MPERVFQDWAKKERPASEGGPNKGKKEEECAAVLTGIWVNSRWPYGNVRLNGLGQELEGVGGAEIDNALFGPEAFGATEF
jgi:hypothetical protein